ncbi:MAG: protein kinase, partial [Planctomycetales bacterium]|nr:protein kinase [Planctomycetales bacterium]NIP85021.1 protein kinase [Planctomycetales bacterium]
MKVRTEQADLTVAQPPDGSASDPSARDQRRFIYRSGSRPLDGFTIKRGIGHGGFGEVYFAVSDGGKEVALKLIRRNFDVELRGVVQCLNLKHPNLVALYDIRCDPSDDHWVVMEHVAGQRLEEVIRLHPEGLPPEEANAWIRGIAAGVAYLHESGIVHRDLKPGNIFSENGLVKIGDYGLSKFISCSRRSGQTESVGTVHYMAPEIANGRYGKEIDLYALGVICYEMLTGRVPFEGESVGEILMKHLTAEPDLTRLAEPYRTIVGRALAKDPRVRYASAAELLADLPPLSAPAPTPLAPQTSPLLPASEAHPARDPAVMAQLADDATDHAPLAGPPPSALPPPEETEEPILRWVKQQCAQFGSAWNNQFNTLVKVVFIAGAIWLILQTSVVLFPALVCLVLTYLVYRACWSLGHRTSAGSAQPLAGPAAASPPPPVAAAASGPPVAEGNPHPAHARRRRWPTPSSPPLPVKTAREKMTELSGSMVLSGVVCLVMSLVMLLLRGVEASSEQYAWLALTSTLGTWGVLIPGKIWEGGDTEPAVRRFWMLVVGLLVGGAAYGVQQHL